MHEEPSHREAYDRIVAILGDAQAPPYEEMTRRTIAASPEDFPLLEDFGADLAAGRSPRDPASRVFSSRSSR